MDAKEPDLTAECPNCKGIYPYEVFSRSQLVAVGFEIQLTCPSCWHRFKWADVDRKASTGIPTYTKTTEVRGTLYPGSPDDQSNTAYLSDAEVFLRDVLPPESLFKPGKFRITVEFTPDPTG